MSIKGAEARGSQRLVDGSIRLHPGKALRHRGGIIGETGREERVEEVGAARAAPVVHEPDDRFYSELAQAVQSFVGPFPIRGLNSGRSDALPKNRITNG